MLLKISKNKHIWKQFFFFHFSRIFLFFCKMRIKLNASLAIQNCRNSWNLFLLQFNPWKSLHLQGVWQSAATADLWFEGQQFYITGAKNFYCYLNHFFFFIFVITFRTSTLKIQHPVLDYQVHTYKILFHAFTQKIFNNSTFIFLKVISKESLIVQTQIRKANDAYTEILLDWRNARSWPVA